MSSLAVLRSSVARKIGSFSGDSNVPPEELNEVLNEGNQSIATEKDWPWLYQEVSGVTTALSSNISLPADLARMIFLTVSGADITPRSPRDLGRFRTDSNGAPRYGPPVYYTPAGSNVKLSPTPGQGTAYPYVMAYIKTEPLLEEDEDEPLLPAPFQGWLVTRAAGLYILSTDNAVRYPKLEAEDQKWMKRVIDNVRRSGALSSIRRTRPSIWQDV